MIEANLFPAKSLSLLLRRPNHPVLVTLFQACSADALHLGMFFIISDVRMTVSTKTLVFLKPVQELDSAQQCLHQGWLSGQALATPPSPGV